MNIDQISGFIAGIIATLFVVGTILEVIGCWYVFNKAGVKGWKSIIPVYRKYILYKSVWNPNICWIWLVAVLLDQIFTNYVTGTIGLLSNLFGVVAFIVNVIMKRKLSRSFGHGVAFTIGLVLAEPLFIFILGFDKSQYLGIVQVPKKEKKRKKVSKESGQEAIEETK